MAATITGSAITINTASTTSSQSITVPADATLAVLIWSGYTGTSTPFDSGGYSFTLGGASFGHITRNADPAFHGGAVMAALANPATGSQTLAWAVSASMIAGVLINVIFCKGCEASIASFGSANESTISPITVSGLTTTADDITIGGAFTVYPVASMVTNSQTALSSIGPDVIGGVGYILSAYKANSSTLSALGSTYGDSTSVVAGVVRGSASATINQHSFKFFNDDGSESGSTSMETLNTNVSLSASEVARLRFIIEADGDPAGAQFRLEYRKKPSGGSFGPWNQVN